MFGFRQNFIWDLWAMGCLNLKPSSHGALFGIPGNGYLNLKPLSCGALFGILETGCLNFDYKG